MTDRTQPAYGIGGPDPALTDVPRPPVTPDRLGTRLIGVSGLYAGHRFALPGAEIQIGRDPGCGVCLNNDKTVSRVHARIALEDSGHVLYDEGSANGTYVNGVLIRTCILAPGDLIQCGTTQLRYE